MGQRVTAPRNPRALEQARAPHEFDQCERHHHPREHRRDPRADQAQARPVAQSVDEQPVRERVEHVRGDRHDHRRAHDLAALQVLTQGREDEEEGQPGDLHHHVGLREARERGVLAERDHGRFGEGPEHADGHAHEQSQHDAALEGQSLLARVAGAVALAHEGIDAEDETHGEDHRPESPDVTECGRGEGFDPDASDHQRVDDAEHHPRELADHERDGQDAESSEFVAQARHGGAPRTS